MNLLKPWYVHRPSQIVRRLCRSIRPAPSETQVVDLPWGCPIEIEISEDIGRCIWTTGVHDLAVAEVLYRLTNKEFLALDIGANVGSMTGVLAWRAKEVWAFEPNPDVFSRLKRNIEWIERTPGFAAVRPYEVAL